MNIEILNTEIELENERVLLIPFENKRNQELKELIFDDGIWKFMGMNMKTKTDFENYITNTLKDKNNGVCYPFLIIDKKNN